MTANPILLQRKYARVIRRYAQLYGESIEESMRKFYKSTLYELVSEGVADMHCMSDDYLAEELHREWTERNNTGEKINE